MSFKGNPKRSKPLPTKGGLVLYYRGRNEWEVDYPEDDWHRYGGATTIKVMNLIHYIAKGKTLEEADRLAFGKIRKR